LAVLIYKLVFNF